MTDDNHYVVEWAWWNPWSIFDVPHLLDFKITLLIYVLAACYASLNKFKFIWNMQKGKRQNENVFTAGRNESRPQWLIWWMLWGGFNSQIQIIKIYSSANK